MRIQQLFEGQQEQIAGLRAHSPVLLYHATSVRDAIEFLTKKSMEQEPKLVTPSLRSAKNFGRVVFKFWAQGRHVYPPRNVSRDKGDQQLAQRLYPESFRPMASFALLSLQNPHAYYVGPLETGNIESLYLVDYDKETGPEEGKISEFEPTQFIKWFVDLMREKRRAAA